MSKAIDEQKKQREKERIAEERRQHGILMARRLRKLRTIPRYRLVRMARRRPELFDYPECIKSMSNQVLRMKLAENGVSR